MLKNLLQKKDLTQDEMVTFLDWLEKGHLNDAQIAAFLVALNCKGITEKELFYAYEYFAKQIMPQKLAFPCLDITGTGGGLHKPLNVSSGSAFVVAAAGCKVTKQINSLVTSSCGSKEVLQALGILLPGTKSPKELLQKHHLAFFPGFNAKAFSLSSSVRKSLKIPTLFEILHPLLHPVAVSHQIIGVFDGKVMKTLAKTLEKLQLSRKIALVYSREGKDEVSPYGKTEVIEIEKGKTKSYEFYPKDLGLEEAFSPSDARSCFSSVNHLLAILQGEKTSCTAWILANASFAFYFVGKVSFLKEGTALAKEILQRKKAYDLYKDFSCKFTEVEN